MNMNSRLCICSERTHAGCGRLLRRSLFFVGAFGANDYLLAMAATSLEQVRSLVPAVVRTISAAVEVTKLPLRSHVPPDSSCGMWASCSAHCR